MKNKHAALATNKTSKPSFGTAVLNAVEAALLAENASAGTKRERKPPPELPADISTKRVLGTRDAAAFLGLSVRDLERKRAAGVMPTPVQLGVRKLGYTVESLNAWIASRSRQKDAA